MNDLLSKISSYHLFNYLLPGCLFAVVADRLGHPEFIQSNLLLGLFLYYFYGLIISRIGSLIIEPFLRWVKFLRFANYPDFVTACQKDPKLDILSETNNMYRTLCSLLLVILLLQGYCRVEIKWPSIRHWDKPIFVVALLAILLFSYRKQTLIITRRVRANL